MKLIFAGREWSSFRDLNGRRISAADTARMPVVKALPGGSEDRFVFLLYDLSTKPNKTYAHPLCTASNRTAYHLHWMRMCGDTIVPYQPMSPPRNQFHRYRLEMYRARRGCSTNVDETYPYQFRWKRNQQNRKAEWIQCLIERLKKGEMWEFVSGATFESGFVSTSISVHTDEKHSLRQQQQQEQRGRRGRTTQPLRTVRNQIPNPAYGGKNGGKHIIRRSERLIVSGN